MAELTSTNAVIEALGGNPGVASITGRTAKAVSNWRGFDTFPSNTYVAMQRALKGLGKTAPDALWGMSSAAAEPERAAS